MFEIKVTSNSDTGQKTIKPIIKDGIMDAVIHTALVLHVGDYSSYDEVAAIVYDEVKDYNSLEIEQALCKVFIAIPNGQVVHIMDEFVSFLLGIKDHIFSFDVTEIDFSPLYV